MSIANAPSSTQEAEARQRPGRQAVVSALRQASQRTGVDFSYLMAKAAQESGLDPAAKARTSSATGLFQFIESTWLGMMEENGGKYGLSELSAKIGRRADGSCFVADPADRAAILELRKDPRIAAFMAAEYARDNRDRLRAQVGGEIGGAELYMAHFLGAGGASRFLNALKRDADQPAAALLPEAAAANRAVFYDKSGRARSVGEIFDRFAARFGDAAAPAGTAAGTRPAGRPGPAGMEETVSASGSSGLASVPAGGCAQPLSLFTVMLLSQLGTPDEEAEPPSAARQRQPAPGA